MKRRNLLTSTTVLAGTALAGCLSLASSDSDPEIHLELTNLQPDPQPDQLTFDIEIANPYLTNDQVPVLDITLENTGTETVEIRGSSSPPLPWPDVGVDPDAVGIAPETQAESKSVEEGNCPTVEGVWTTLDLRAYRVEPGDVYEDTRAILPIGNNSDGDCPPAGTYRAEQRMNEDQDWGFGFDLVET